MSSGQLDEPAAGWAVLRSDRALRRNSGSGVFPTGPVSRRAAIAEPPSHRADEPPSARTCARAPGKRAHLARTEHKVRSRRAPRMRCPVTAVCGRIVLAKTILPQGGCLGAVGLFRGRWAVYGPLSPGRLKKGLFRAGRSRVQLHITSIKTARRGGGWWVVEGTKHSSHFLSFSLSVSLLSLSPILLFSFRFHLPPLKEKRRKERKKIDKIIRR